MLLFLEGGDGDFLCLVPHLESLSLVLLLLLLHLLLNAGNLVFHPGIGLNLQTQVLCSIGLLRVPVHDLFTQVVCIVSVVIDDMLVLEVTIGKVDHARCVTTSFCLIFGVSWSCST